MISLSLQWRRLRTNLSRRKSQNSWSSHSSRSSKSVRFYAIDTVFYTHSSAEYDRKSPTEEVFDALSTSSFEQEYPSIDLISPEDEQTFKNTDQNRRHVETLTKSQFPCTRIVFMP
ncbi:hypothetical protein BDF14DRAFT_1845902 [Spinellus fusiger]|nr:hypothetical protein BDF14DRAFT_1845902 [Spinellus fusiger]